MAVTVERLIATLEARIDKYEKNLAKAYGQTDRQFKRIEQRGKMMETRFRAIGAGIGRNFVAALAAGFTVGKIKQFSDAATRIDNALKVAGVSGKDLEKVYGALRDSATRNAAPIETLVELYSRAAMAADNLGASQDDLIKFADNVAKSLRVSGKSAQESAGALLQLSQLMSGSVVQAQEYNSLIDGAYPLLQAVAAGLKEAGGDVGKLTQLVKSGQVPTRAFFDAFQAGSVILDQKVADATFTISQALGNLYTSLVDTARELNQVSGAGRNAADGINATARAITDFDVSGFIQKISGAKGALENFLHDLGNAGIFTSLNQMLGIADEDGNFINLETKAAKDKAEALEREVKLLQDTIAKNTELGIDNTDAIARLNEVQTTLSHLRAQIANMPDFSLPTINVSTSADKINDMVPFNPLPPLTQAQTVSLADFKPPSKPGGSGGSGGSGGGGRSPSDIFGGDVEQIKARTAAIRAETEALAGLNPLVNDYGYTVQRVGAQQDLLNSAQRAGLKITPELRATIDQLADGYAAAGAEAAKLAASQDEVRNRAEEMRDLGRDVMGGFIHDLLDGKSAADALADALGRVGDRLIDMALNNLFGGGGGLFSSLLGGGGGLSPAVSSVISAGGVGLFAKGGIATSPGIIGEGPYNEAAVPLPDGRRIPVDLRMPTITQRQSAQTSATQAIAINVNVSGARGNTEISQMVERGVRSGISEFSRNGLPARVQQINIDPRKIG